MNAQLIKQTLSMRQVIERYGIQMNRGMYIACPFHEEKTPSLKIYDEPGRGWNCFGCGQGGSVIDFIIKYFRLTYKQALIRIGSDFGFSDDPPDREAERRISAEQAAKRLAEQRRQTEINQLAAAHCTAWKTVKTAPAWSDEWCKAINQIDYLYYRMEVLECPK